MSTLSHFRAATESLQRTVTLKAWRIAGPIAHPLDISADDWDEALAEALPGLGHKDTLAILRTDAGRDDQRVRFYAIKQRSKPIYVRKPGFAHAVQHRPLYAEMMFELAVEAFEPVRPFDAFRDDAVGCDRSLVGNG